MTKIIFIYTLLVYGDQSTQVPSDHTTIFSPQSSTDIPDPTSTSVTSTSITSTSSTSQENSYSRNRGFHGPWRPTSWRPPVPIHIPTFPAPTRRKSINCGQTWAPQGYEVTDHDDQGKCKDCYRIQRSNTNGMKGFEPWKVINGKNALPGEVPWNIEIYHNHNVFKGCGGTLISPSKILSAAHCFHTELETSPNRSTDYINLLYKYKAVAGLLHRDFWRNSPDMQTRDIEKIAIPR